MSITKPRCRYRNHVDYPWAVEQYRQRRGSIGTGHADNKAPIGTGNVDAKQEHWTTQDYWTGTTKVNKTPVSHSQPINSPVLRVRSNDDSQARDRTKTRTSNPNEESQPQRSRHGLQHQRQSNHLQGCRWILLYFLPQRSKGDSESGRLQQRQQAATAISKITPITKTRLITRGITRYVLHTSEKVATVLTTRNYKITNTNFNFNHAHLGNFLGYERTNEDAQYARVCWNIISILRAARAGGGQTPPRATR